MVALSDAPCGIDIENLSKQIRKNKDFMPLAKRVCTEKEIPNINSTNDLISIWTKKESIYKYLGLDNINIFDIECDKYFCRTHEMNLGEDYILSLCCEGENEIKITII